MNTTLVRRVATSTVVVLAATSCGGAAGTPPAQPAVFTVALSGALADDSAILFHVGSGATAVSAAGGSGLRVNVVPRDGGYHVVVLGPLRGAALVTVTMPDAGAPTLAVLDVAASDGTLRTVPNPYSLNAAVVP